MKDKQEFDSECNHDWLDVYPPEEDDYCILCGITRSELPPSPAPSSVNVSEGVVLPQPTDT